MTTSRDSLPDITRPDANIALISEWTVDTPEHPRAPVGHEPWPEDLISDNYYVEIEGDTVLRYSQWESEETAAEFVRTGHPEWSGRSDAVPDSERHAITPYRLYRSFVPSGAPRTRGCVVVITFETDGRKWQHKLVDWLVDRLPDNVPHPGNISNHFHISTDGTQVFNYTEWTDAGAHQDVVENSLREDDEVPRMIDAMDGVRGLGYKRFTLHRSLATP